MENAVAAPVNLREYKSLLLVVKGLRMTLGRYAISLDVTEPAELDHVNEIHLKLARTATELVQLEESLQLFVMPSLPERQDTPRDSYLKLFQRRDMGS